MNVIAAHESDVLALSKHVKGFYKTATRVKIYHGSTNSTRAQTFDPKRMVDISHLNRILEINVKAGYALVEPNVPMDVLIDATMQEGMIPPVIMEFPGITTGGGIQGGALESSSFKEGAFHTTCIEYEIVLATGEIVTASREERSDLFWGTACSYGTLGIITLAKIRLIPTRKYVELTYTRVNSFEDMVTGTQKVARTNVDFVDGIMFSSERGTIITGVRTDKSRYNISRFLRAWDQWFYIHADAISKKHPVYTESIPLKDYLFRYDRGGFWVGMYGFRRWSVPFNRFTRFVFNPFLKTRELYDILHATNTSQQFIIQDISLPESNTRSFLKFVDEQVGCYPLWICPLRQDPHARLAPAHLDTEMVINVGVWGELPNSIYEYEALHELNRQIERVTQELGGRKMLYAHTYYRIEEFWNIYGAEWYANLREKYQASQTFPDMYEKVYVTDRYHADIEKGLGNLIRQKTKEMILRIPRKLIALARA